MNTNANEALNYASKGWSIFPAHSIVDGKCTCGNPDCKSPGKHPMTPHGLKDASTDPIIINDWWTKWPDANVAIVTGKASGLVVLDIDNKHEGFESLAKLQEKHGALPETLTVKTGNGRHYYFMYSISGEEILNTTRLAGYDGLDLRGQNGYVIAPPSNHISGNIYEWGTDLENTTIAPMPDWLLELIRDPRKNLDDQNKSTLFYSEADAITVASNSWIVKSLRELREGNRNDSFSRLIGRFINDGFIESEICELLLPHAERCDFSHQEFFGEVSGMFKRYENPETNMAMNLTTLTELLNEEDEEESWIVDGLIPRGGLSILVAKPKIGKSTLARQLAVCVTSGTPFLDRDTQKGRVLYLALEEKRNHVRHSFRRLGEISDDLYFFIGSVTSNVIKDLQRIAAEVRPILIVIDTIGRFTRVQNWSDYSQVLEGLDPLLSFARDYNIAAVLLHHARKGDAAGIDGILGSTAIAGTVDTIIQMEVDGELPVRILSTTQRSGEEMRDKIIEFNPETGKSKISGSLEEVIMDKMKQDILEYLKEQSEPITDRDIASAVSGNKGLRLRALRLLVEGNQITRTGNGHRGNPYFFTINYGFTVQPLGLELETRIFGENQENDNEPKKKEVK